MEIAHGSTLRRACGDPRGLSPAPAGRIVLVPVELTGDARDSFHMAAETGEAPA